MYTFKLKQRFKAEIKNIADIFVMNAVRILVSADCF